MRRRKSSQLSVQERFLNACAVLDLRLMEITMSDIDDNRKEIETTIQSIVPYRSHQTSFVDFFQDTICCVEKQSSLDLICHAKFSPLTSEELPGLVFDLYYQIDVFLERRKDGSVRIDSRPNCLPSSHWDYEKLRCAGRAVIPFAVFNMRLIRLVLPNIFPD